MDTRRELLDLLASDAIPPGEYLVYDDGEHRVLWKINEGEPHDGALDPAPRWSLLTA